MNRWINISSTTQASLKYYRWNNRHLFDMVGNLEMHLMQFDVWQIVFNQFIYHNILYKQRQLNN